MNCPKCGSVLYEIINGNLLCTKCQIQYDNPNIVKSQKKETDNPPPSSPKTKDSKTDISKSNHKKYNAKRKRRERHFIGLWLPLILLSLIWVPLILGLKSLIPDNPDYILYSTPILGIWLIIGPCIAFGKSCPNCGSQKFSCINKRLIDERSYNETYDKKEYIYQNGRATDQYILSKATKKVIAKTYLIDYKCKKCDFIFVDKKTTKKDIY